MQTEYSYKNISEQTLSIPGVGVVEPGEVIKSSEPINNANLELVAGGDTAPKKDKETINENETEIK